MTTDSSGVHATEVAVVTEVAATNSGGSGGSNGAMIGGKSSLYASFDIVGIVAGVIGFLILALLGMSVVLYILVRRSVERRQAQRDSVSGEGKETHSRSSVAASDTPEVYILLLRLLMNRMI